MSKSYQQQYAEILRKLINEPKKQSGSRVGDTRSLFAETIRVDLQKEFPLMEIKNVSFKNILVELLWFIRGDTNIKYLVENKCNIWNDDAYRYYKENYSPYRFKREDAQLSLEFDDEITKEQFIERVVKGEKLVERYRDDKGYLSDSLAWMDTTYAYGDMNRIYGFQWRNFNGSSDQLLTAIETLKTNPDSRRIIVTAHNPTDIERGVVALPSCHNYFQFYSTPLTLEERKKYVDDGQERSDGDWEVLCAGIPKRKLSLYYNLRSNDFFLGQPYNTPSYSLLLMMISEIVGMIPDEVVCNMVDCHLYEEHVEPAKEWLNRYDDRFADNNEYSHEREELFTFCKSNVSIVSRDNIDKFKFEDFTLKNYVADKSIKAKLLT